MIPHTYPSLLEGNSTKMVVYSLPSVDGLVAWVDYIPVKAPPDADDLTVANTFAANGFILSSALESIDGKQAWLDYIPVFVSESGTIPWSTDAGGYIPLDAVSAIVEFSPSSLFANSEVGVWYDPSDVNVNWRKNSLGYTQEFESWITNDLTVTANATTAPDGTTTANKLVENALLQDRFVRATNAFGTIGVSSTFSVYAKKAERNWIYLLTFRQSGTTCGAFDLDNGVTGTQNNCTSSIEDVGDGWYRCSITYTTTNETSSYAAIIGVSDQNTGSYRTYQGDGSSGVYIWGAQMEDGTSTATAYQRIVTPEITYVADVQPQPILYQNNIGTIPVTAVEQPVGLMLDKSQGLVLGSELVTNGDFSDGTTGWTGLNATIAVSSGQLTITQTASNPGAWQAFSGAAEKTYRISFDVIAGTCQISFKTSVDGTGATITGNSTGLFGVGSHTVYVKPVAAFNSIKVGDGTAPITVDNISVKELPGNHALQSTSASRPTLSARYNLLTYTEQFDNAIWSKSNVTITANATTAPDGTSTADKITQSVVSALTVQIAQLKTILASVNYTYSIYLKQNDCEDYIKILLGSSNQTSGFGLSIDPSDMTVQYANAAGTGYNYVSHSVESVGNGWYCVSITGSSSTTTSIAAYIAFNDNATGSHSSDRITNGGTGSFYIWGADLRVANDGVNLPVYQRVAAATDYDTVGFPTYLAFDGVDDYMVTSWPLGSATDLSIFTGTRRIGTSSARLIDFDGSYDFAVFSPNTTAPNEIQFLLGGSNAVGYPLISTPTTIVTSANHASGVSTEIEVNNTLGDTGTFTNTEFGTGSVNIGRRLTAVAYFNGRLYSMIVRNSASTETEITDTEDWVNNVTKAWS